MWHLSSSLMVIINYHDMFMEQATDIGQFTFQWIEKDPILTSVSRVDPIFSKSETWVSPRNTPRVMILILATFHHLWLSLMVINNDFDMHIERATDVVQFTFRWIEKDSSLASLSQVDPIFSKTETWVSPLAPKNNSVNLYSTNNFRHSYNHSLGKGSLSQQGS